MTHDHVDRTDDEPTKTSSNDDTKRLIARMQSSDAIFDPNHFHSFQSISFLLLPIHSCAGCGQRLATKVWGSARPLQCVACGSYAHRSCAFSTTLQWKETCRVNSTNIKITDHDRDENDVTENRQRRDDEPIEGDKKEVDSGLSSSGHLTESAQVMNELEHACESSIFRAARQVSLLDSHDHSDGPKIQCTKSEDGILDGGSRHSRSMDVQKTKANFPFLSAVQLFHKTTPIESEFSIEASHKTIYECNTWTESSEYPVVEKDDNAPDVLVHPAQHPNGSTLTDCDDYLWTTSGPTPHWSNDDVIAEISVQAKQIREEEAKLEEDGPVGPLHLASGFRVVSQALQENIIATFGRLVSKEEHNKFQGKTATESNVIAEAELPQDTLSDGRSAESGKQQDVQLLLEEAQIPEDSLAEKKRLGIGYIAGGVAGGLAGLVLAGPAGGLIGIKFGQLGAIGILLEGSFTVGALAGGVAAGQNIGKHLDDKIQESRVLALGEGTQRQVLLLIRPSIQPPDSAWYLIYQEARRTYSGGGSGFVRRFISSEMQAANRERYEREVDIVEMAESELSTTDKVMLLVSRILNNKDSLPGHVHRHLIEAFRKRAVQDAVATENSSSFNEPTYDESSDSKNDGEELSIWSTRRRQDTHAIIKYVTAALLQTRPGFGCSATMTEMTATAVESLVFGEVYDMVMAEIIAEKAALDVQLLSKIDKFETRQKGEESIGNIDGSKSLGIFNPVVSQSSVKSLLCLPEAHSAVDKLRYCVNFLEGISEYFSATELHALGADSLLPMVCQHIVAAKVPTINAEVSFLEEFARDEQLLRGREGYSLVTLQAALHYLNSSNDFESDIFCPQDPVVLNGAHCDVD